MQCSIHGSGATRLCRTCCALSPGRIEGARPFARLSFKVLTAARLGRISPPGWSLLPGASGAYPDRTCTCVATMTPMAWNHNIHYHDVVLHATPSPCECALDAGCGTGLLTRRLAERCEKVVAIDCDRAVIASAHQAASGDPRITFVEGDLMTHSFSDASFDFITAVAVLHHLPLKPALLRLRSLLKPGGVLVIIGLYRSRTIQDFAWAAPAFAASWVLRRFRGHADVAAPIREPAETLAEIRNACEILLPDCVFRRRLLFRYSVTWRKP